MKPIDVTSDSYAEHNEDFIEKDPKIKVGDRVRVLKYKSTFLKDTLKIGRTTFLLLVKLKKQFLEHT